MDTRLSHQISLPLLPTRRDSKGFGVCALPSRRLRSAAVVATAGASRCDPGSSLNAPLEPRSAQGRFLSSVLQNKRQLFHFAAADELKQLADDRESAVSRKLLSSGSDEACLHRRIAQLKEHYSQIAVQDIMYMLIFYKFSEIRVPLVPKLSRCIYNGRLEIWPSKDWELESIHSIDALELIKEHVSAVIGLRVNSSVTDNWATTQIQKLHLGRVYTASILYGYFLKSATLRHQLECSLSDLQINQQRPIQFPKGPVFGCSFPTSTPQAFENRELKHLRHYISGFNPETLQRCAKPRSEEARNLIEKQSIALFGQEKGDEVVVTSFSSLKRLVLEAVAFGTFLWDTEEYVDGVYKLKENDNAEEEEESSSI
ncbi:PREDICTED: UV-B-induced protein At3g17800, chloroplastic-like [Tarenaya hassleriana]|uniref:UV-B-induced protein At3g17800, chloroplastic-like n=1 Tax=Tarenaya hassleriana TaxID=28532 RepID=UPI00053C7C88|nr:PREDICTED: UV-B-induced protein At3g17800, chloroplastic-like [Tarenaya hassleriana]